MNKIYLYLETGQEFQGKCFTTPPSLDYLSEIVFNTSMQGYQEVVTDPSYCDQSIVMTYPLIGNYGINQDDNESIHPALKTFIVREHCSTPSNFRSRQDLGIFLSSRGVTGIEGIDTRMLTKIIRETGTMKCIVSPSPLSSSVLDDKFKSDLTQNQIEKTSTKTIAHFPANGGIRIVMLDFGYKKNILESLLKRKCDVIVVPFDTSFEKIQEFSPQGILLSNGPGDPKSIKQVIPTIKKLQEKYPMLAICMGHQIFALANGADTEKMKFGHRGGNHPVKDFAKDRVYITSQNHGYCVTEKSINDTDLEITQINMNDKTIEGLKHKTLNAYSVQYHPEASPGPNDTKYMFDDFLTTINEVSNA